MRILLVNTRHYGGGGDSTYTFNLGNLLRGNGHNVAFFAMQDPRNLTDPNSDVFVSRIDFKELNRRKNVFTGLQVLLRVIYSSEARKKFSILLDRFNPEIVHLQNLHAHITPSVVFEAKKRGLPVVWTLHDYKLICPNSHFLVDQTAAICEACGRARYYQPLLKRCKKGSLVASGMAGLEAIGHRLMGVRSRVDTFIAPSEFLRRKMVEHGLNGDRVLHLPYFIPSEGFKFRSGEAGTHEPYILFLGKIDPLKGIKDLFEACRLNPGVRVLLAGRVDEEGARLLRACPPNATWVGVKQVEQLRDLLQQATALVLPSIWYENQPLCILEAFACAKSVVASRLGGMTELVADKERGLLVPPGDPRSLGEALEWILSHPCETAAMGQNAYKYALANFHPKTHYERIMALYSEVSARIRGVRFGEN